MIDDTMLGETDLVTRVARDRIKPGCPICKKEPEPCGSCISDAEQMVELMRPFLLPPDYGNANDLVEQVAILCRHVDHDYENYTGIAQKIVEAINKRERDSILDKRILIGGNHLASSLLSTADPVSIDDYDDALRKHGQPYADMWVCWRAIMDVRDGLPNNRRWWPDNV